MAEQSSPAPAADVAMWLRAGMAAQKGHPRSQSESMTLMLQHEQARSAASAAAKFEVESGDAAREEIKREFEAEQLAKTNRQLKAMVVRLRDELKQSQGALAQERGGLPTQAERAAEHQGAPQASEEEFRNRTVSLINHLQEQVSLAELREKQSVDTVRQQLVSAQAQLESAHTIRDQKEARTWQVQDWFKEHFMDAGVAARVIPAFEEMEMPPAEWVSMLEAFSPAELAEFIAELPPVAGGSAEEAGAAPGVQALVLVPEMAATSLPSAAPIGSPRVTRESGDAPPIPRPAAAAADAAADRPATPTTASTAKPARQPSVWDGVPTPDSRDAVRIIAEMGATAPLQRWRLSGMVAEDAPVFQPETDLKVLPFASFRGSSAVTWDDKSRPEEGNGLIVRTQFGDADNLHWVGAAAGAREQLTFFDGSGLGDVAMRPTTDGVAADGDTTAAGAGGCCAYVLGSDEVALDGEVQSGVHGVHLFNMTSRRHMQLAPVVEADASRELALDGGESGQPTRTPEEKGRSSVRKDCGLCWTRDGEELVWASSAGAKGGLDLVHWHAATGTTRRLVCAQSGESLLPLGFAPSRKKLLLVKRIRSAEESELCLLNLGNGALADGSFRPSPTLTPLFERQLCGDRISYGGVAGLGLGADGGWAGASWGGVTTGSFAGLVYGSDEGAECQRLRYCVVDTELCEVIHDCLLADHGESQAVGGIADVICVACSAPSASVAYVRTVEQGKSTALYIVDTSEIAAAARTGVPLTPEAQQRPMQPPKPEPESCQSSGPRGVPGFGVVKSLASEEDAPEETTAAEPEPEVDSAVDLTLITNLQFSFDGSQLAVTVQTPRSVADVYVLTTIVDVHKVRTRVWSRWTSSELGGIPPSEIVTPRSTWYPSEDPWTKNADGSSPLRIPMLVYEPPRGAANPKAGRPVVVWLPDLSLTGTGSATSTSLSVSSPLASTQGCVLDAGIQLLVRETGCVVVVPHVRGSSGYGNRYTGLAKQHRREAAVKDVRSLLSWLAQKALPPPPSPADAAAPVPGYDLSRVALYGVGCGGFLAASVSATLCALGSSSTPVVPCCVALERPVTNLVTFLAETAAYLQPILREELGCVYIACVDVRSRSRGSLHAGSVLLTLSVAGGLFRDERGVLDEETRLFLQSLSPTRLCHTLDVPVMVFSSTDDGVVSAEEAVQLSNALRAGGRRPVTLVGSGHDPWARKRRHRQVQLGSLLRFFAGKLNAE